MREDKRFRILERKGLEYIFDTENTPAFWDEDVDFIELLGDSLSEQEIVDLLNKQDEEIKKLKDDNQRLINKLNTTALELATDYISMGKAVEISEMSYHDFLKYRNDNGKPMELRL